MAYMNGPPQSEDELLTRFLPFDQCQPGVKALLFPHVDGLLEKVRRELLPYI